MKFRFLITLFLLSNCAIKRDAEVSNPVIANGSTDIPIDHPANRSVVQFVRSFGDLSGSLKIDNPERTEFPFTVSFSCHYDKGLASLTPTSNIKLECAGVFEEDDYHDLSDLGWRPGKIILEFANNKVKYNIQTIKFTEAVQKILRIENPEPFNSGLKGEMKWGNRSTSEVQLVDSNQKTKILLTDNRFDAYCTGTLIAQNLVLIAGHCVEGLSQKDAEYAADVLKKYIIFSQTTREGTKVLKKMQVFEMLEHPFRRHNPTFSISSHDVAWVKLPENAPSSFVPLEIFTKEEDLKPNLEFTMAGYGRVESTAIPLKKHEKRITQSKVERYINEAPFHESIILYQAGISGFCEGDSGGPILIYRNNQWFVSGVVHGSSTDFGHRGGCGDTGGIYIYPARYIEWIEQTSNVKLKYSGRLPSQVAEYSFGPQTIEKLEDVCKKYEKFSRLEATFKKEFYERSASGICEKGVENVKTHKNIFSALDGYFVDFKLLYEFDPDLKSIVFGGNGEVVNIEYLSKFNRIKELRLKNAKLSSEQINFIKGLSNIEEFHY